MPIPLPDSEGGVEIARRVEERLRLRRAASKRATRPRALRSNVSHPRCLPKAFAATLYRKTLTTSLPAYCFSAFAQTGPRTWPNPSVHYRTGKGGRRATHTGSNPVTALLPDADKPTLLRRSAQAVPCRLRDAEDLSSPCSLIQTPALSRFLIHRPSNSLVRTKP